MPPTADQVAQRLRTAATRVREWFQRRLDEQSLDIARLYAAERDRFLARIGQIYQAYLAADPTIMAARRGPAGLLLDQAITETTAALGDELGRSAVSHLSTVLDATPAQVAKHYAAWSQLAFADLPETSQRALRELTTSVVGGGTFFDRVFNVTATLQGDITKTIRSGLINGDDFMTIRGRMMKVFGVDKLADPKGAAYGSVRTYRNAAADAFSKMILDVGEEAGGVALWWATLDAATTPGCAARHGRPISQVGSPPRHWNCRCTASIVERGADLSEFRAEADAWLADAGYTRRQAGHMEAWAWVEAWDPADPGLREAFDPNQPRVPAGAPEGGQWGPGGAGGGFASAAPDAFVAARNKSARTGYLSPLTPDDLKGRQSFLNAEGTVGYVLNDGDLENLFNNGGPKGAGREAIFDALDQGGRTLDCFDGYLPDLYTQFGFTETGRMRFNRAYAPPGWDYEKNDDPDVVFMAWQGLPAARDVVRATLNGDRRDWLAGHESTRYHDDYDAAKAVSRGAVYPRPGRTTEGSGLGGSTRRAGSGAGQERRRAVAAPVWGWGRWRLLPLYHVPPERRLEAGDHHYQALPWTSLPALASGDQRGDWSTERQAFSSGGPDHVLVRRPLDRDDRSFEVRATEGWVPLVPTTGREVWVPTPTGRALDGPDGIHWQERAQRPPLDVIAAWPGLREVALPLHRHTSEQNQDGAEFPTHKYGSSAYPRWRVAVVGPEEAEAIALGEAWDPALHPRAPAGNPEGGEFTSGGGGGGGGRDRTGVRKALGDTKAVDDAGEPVRVYHGTTVAFADFKASKTKNLIWGPGIYFTESPESANVWAQDEERPGAGNVHAGYLKVEKPFDLEAPGSLEFWSKHAAGKKYPMDSANKAVRAAGYDAITYKTADGDRSWVVFDPKQVVHGFALESGRDFGALVREALAQAPQDDPHLVVYAGGTYDRMQLHAVISCTTGRFLYTREAFEGLAAPYQRAAVAVFEGEGLVWAIRPRGLSFWSLPGGHLDPGERPVDAAMRELYEETGVTATRPRFLGRLYRSWSTTHVFVAERTGELDLPTSPDETDAVQLVSIDDLDPTERAFLLRQARPDVIKRRLPTVAVTESIHHR